MSRSGAGVLRGVACACALVVVAGCSSSSTDDKTAEAHAKKLTAAAHSAGVAPGLTVSAAESLYGTSASQICDVLDGGVSSAEQLLLNGNPAGRRGQLVTTDAVTYERLVVRTYCPDHLSTYNELVKSIDATKPTG